MPWQVYPSLRETGIVYYLERRDGLIKIGYTQRYPSRRAKLLHQHGPLWLVAWEAGPGGLHELSALEEQRHQQFARLRLPGKNPGLLCPPEWFALDEDLYDHLLMLKALL